MGQARGRIATDRAGEGEGGAPSEAVVVDVPQTMLSRAEGEAEPGDPAGDKLGEGEDSKAEGAGGQGGNRAGPGVDGVKILGQRGEGGNNS